MLLKHLINPKPTIMLFFIVFCVIFSAPFLKNTPQNVFLGFLNLPFYIIFILTLIAPFLLGLGLNNLIYERNIIRKDNLVIGFVFVLISSAFNTNLNLLFSAFLMLFFFSFLLGSYQKEMPFSQLYNASFLLSIITFIYPNLIFLYLLLIINGINYNNLSWRIFFIILLGGGTPYLFFFTINFLTDTPFLLPNFFNFSKINFTYLSNLYIEKTSLIITIIILLFSFFELFTWLYKKSIKSRRTFMTIIWFFIISTGIALYSGNEYFYFSLIPLSIIISNYFIYTKNRKIANTLFFLLIISSFFYKYLIGYYV